MCRLDTYFSNALDTLMGGESDQGRSAIWYIWPIFEQGTVVDSAMKWFSFTERTNHPRFLYARHLSHCIKMLTTLLPGRRWPPEREEL